MSKAPYTNIKQSVLDPFHWYFKVWNCHILMKIRELEYSLNQLKLMNYSRYFY